MIVGGSRSTASSHARAAGRTNQAPSRSSRPHGETQPRERGGKGRCLSVTVGARRWVWCWWWCCCCCCSPAGQAWGGALPLRAWPPLSGRRAPGHGACRVPSTEVSDRPVIIGAVRKAHTKLVQIAAPACGSRFSQRKKAVGGAGRRTYWDRAPPRHARAHPPCRPTRPRRRASAAS
jgi:hypothetical protein